MLAWLRGELDGGTLQRRKLPPTPPPTLPNQGVGLHFSIDARGVIGIVPASALDGSGNNIALLRSLHPTLSELACNLLAELSQGNKPHGELLKRVASYQAVLNQPLDGLDTLRLYVEGTLLASTYHAVDKKIADKDLPPLSVGSSIVSTLELAAGGGVGIITNLGSQLH